MNIHHFNELPIAQQDDIAEQVSYETKSLYGTEQKITPVEPSDIFLKDIGMVALHNNDFMGYIAATDPNPRTVLYGYELMTETPDTDASRTVLDGKFKKVGSLVVLEPFRSSGIGNNLILAITQEVIEAGSTPFAFCNQSSQPCFAEAGYVETLAEELPSDFQSPFGNQPMIYTNNISVRHLRQFATLTHA